MIGSVCLGWLWFRDEGLQAFERDDPGEGPGGSSAASFRPVMDACYPEVRVMRRDRPCCTHATAFLGPRWRFGRCRPPGSVGPAASLRSVTENGKMLPAGFQIRF